MVHVFVFDSGTPMPPGFYQQVVALLEAEGFAEAPCDSLTEPALHPVYFLAVEDGIVMSYGRTIHTAVEHLGRQWILYGLGDVVTRPSARRMGLGSRIVAEATRHICSQKEADGALLLTTPELELFYAPHGWTHMPNLATPGHRGFLMMLFVSPAAQAARASIGTQPLVLPGDEW